MYGFWGILGAVLALICIFIVLFIIWLIIYTIVFTIASKSGHELPKINWSNLRYFGRRITSGIISAGRGIASIPDKIRSLREEEIVDYTQIKSTIIDIEPDIPEPDPVPVVRPKPAPVAEPKPVVAPGPTPAPAPVIKTEPVVEQPKPAPKPVVAPAPKAEPAPVATPKPAPVAEPKPTPAPAPVVKTEPVVEQPKPAPKPVVASAPKAEPTPVATPKPAPVAEPKPAVAPAPKAEPAPAATPKPIPAPVAAAKAEPKPAPEPVAAPKPKTAPKPAAALERVTHIDTSDGREYAYSYEVLNSCFNKSYKTYSKSSMYLNNERSIQVWFPKVYQTVAAAEKAAETSKENVFAISKNGLNIHTVGKITDDGTGIRIVFAKIGRKPYKFLGVFSKDLSKSKKDSLYFKQIADEADLTNWQ